MELELEVGCCFIFKKVFLTLCFLISRKKAFAKVFIKNIFGIHFFFQKIESNQSSLHYTKKKNSKFSQFFSLKYEKKVLRKKKH
jgi:hypothetical protein